MSNPQVTFPVIPATAMFCGPQGVPIDIQDIVVVLSGSATNTSIVAAVAGKRVRVIGLEAYSVGALTTVAFKSASGGVSKYILTVPASTGNPPDLSRPPNALGWFDTNSGEGLFADCGSVGVAVCVRYILVDPLT
jgi:hypothetical protein